MRSNELTGNQIDFRRKESGKKILDMAWLLRVEVHVGSRKLNIRSLSDLLNNNRLLF